MDSVFCCAALNEGQNGFAYPYKHLRADRIPYRLKRLLASPKGEVQYISPTVFPNRWTKRMFACDDHWRIVPVKKRAKHTDYMKDMDVFAQIGIAAMLDIPMFCPLCGLDYKDTGYILSLSDQLGNAHVIRLGDPDHIRMLISFFLGFSWYLDSFASARTPLQLALPDLCKMFKIKPESIGLSEKSLKTEFYRPWPQKLFGTLVWEDDYST